MMWKIGVFAFAIGVLFRVAAYGRDVDPVTVPEQTLEQRVKREVAADSARQYDLAHSHGTAADRCVAAMAAVAAYQLTEDAEGYASWVKIREVDCANAGLLSEGNHD